MSTLTLRQPEQPGPAPQPRAPKVRRPGESRTRRRLAGVVLLLVPALLVWLSIAVYEKEFTYEPTVTVLTSSAGNEMHRGAEVKMRGVVIGQVRDISADGTGARLTLAIKPDRIGAIPADVTAQMLPTTLFGQRYVALVAPPGTSSTRALAAGGVIPQDRTKNAVELEQVLDNVLPTLTAVQPDKLSATLSAVSQALEGRGGEIGDSIVTLERYLKKANPQLPAFNRDITQLVKVAKAYGDAAPDVVQALADFSTTSRTLAEQRAGLSTMYGATTATSRDLTTFLRQNKDNIIRLSASGRPTLELLGRYAPSFPCTLKTLADFVPAMDRALGKGTDKPGMHVNVKSVPSLGKYVPGRDTPRYDSGGGPRCYGVPYGTRAASLRQGSLGLPNSPQENQLVTELMAPAAKKAPADLPDWSSVLAGPVLRGTEVKLK
ncbi:MCE family protein [Streptomyces monticola]|uniref:MCE family protein n=1 Tax=Streptomyces monticola TaxID=2666263 RepID=A0ABW2JCD4_9ACTN